MIINECLNSDIDKSQHADADPISERQFLHCIFEFIIPLLIYSLYVIHLLSSHLHYLLLAYSLRCYVLRTQLLRKWDLGLDLGSVDVGVGGNLLLGFVYLYCVGYSRLYAFMASLVVSLTFECIAHVCFYN